MLIHSIIPDEIIFPQSTDKEEKTQDIVIKGGTILETRHRHGDIYEVVRLISTDPTDYLKGIYNPGTHLYIE